MKKNFLKIIGLVTIVAFVSLSCGGGGSGGGGGGGGGDPIYLTDDIAAELFGTWIDKTNNGSESTLKFSENGISGSGSDWNLIVGVLNSTVNISQATSSAWIANNEEISFKYSYNYGTPITIPMYKYSINSSGELELTAVRSGLQSTTMVKDDGSAINLTDDIATELFGTWVDKTNNGATLTITFSYSGITWSGSSGDSLNSTTSSYKGAGYTFVWIANNEDISYKYSDQPGVIYTVPVYTYDLNNSGELVLTAASGSGLPSVTMVKEGSIINNDIATELFGTWVDKTNNGTTLTITFSETGITWSGSSGDSLNSSTSSYQGTGYNFAWIANNEEISFEYSYNNGTPITIPMYKYSINNSGELVLTAASGSGLPSVTMVKEGSIINKSKAEGIYIGIIKFAERSEDITGGAPILLNKEGKTSLTNIINSQVSISANPGTALFHAVHLALANLKKNESDYPDKLDFVNIITFTDGLDVSSAGLSLSPEPENKVEGKEFSTAAAYTTYVNAEINSRKIANKSITAYSVGVKGDDVSDDIRFTNDLASIASAGKSNELSDFADLQDTFNDIAEGLNITTTITDFILATTLFENGTKVRMTFDVNTIDPTDAAASTRYIEGIYNISGGVYTLTNITYGGGISSNNGAGPITGTYNSSTLEVSFVLNNITGYTSSDRSNTRQWTMIPSASTWQHNSEYNTAGSSTSTVEKRSTVIYLVLDCSRSLSSSEVAQIKDAAVSFINNLYDQAGSDFVQPMEMVRIPAGTFVMGSPTDETQHSVTLTTGFYMSKYLVTQEQYFAVMGTNPSSFSSSPATGENQAKRPVERVSWYDALVFCNKLSDAEGLTPAYSINGSTDPADWGTVPTSSNSTWNAVAMVSGANGYRLPTEAQWEYACRAGTTTEWFHGNVETGLGDYAWYSSNSGSKTHEVGKKLPNAWGLYDMHGNVWEWCWDWYSSSYYDTSSSLSDPVGPVSGSYRVLRGGYWSADASYLRSASRSSGAPGSRSLYLGFRVVRP
ncbi:MAG: formylglycine-generating enzyme family protein [Leptospirales bacterium]|nr:formylglycine-generating enzyme family protein [Leptospirales bacterium]